MTLVKRQITVRLPEILAKTPPSASAEERITTLLEWLGIDPGEDSEVADLTKALVLLASRTLPAFRNAAPKKKLRGPTSTSLEYGNHSPLTQTEGAEFVAQIDKLLRQEKANGNTLSVLDACKQLKAKTRSRTSVTTRAPSTLSRLYFTERKRIAERQTRLQKLAELLMQTKPMGLFGLKND